MYWRDDGRGSKEERKANAWKRKVGVDGLTVEPLLPEPQGRGQLVLLEQREFGLPFDFMRDLERLSGGRHRSPHARHVSAPVPAPAPVSAGASVPLARSTIKSAKGTALSRSSSRQSRTSNATTRQPVNPTLLQPGEKRFLDHVSPRPFDLPRRP